MPTRRMRVSRGLGRLRRFLGSLGGTPFLLALTSIWLRPAPHVLYGTDAAVYAQVGKEILQRPLGQWTQWTWEGRPFFEHPPGVPLLLACVARLRGRLDAALAVTLAQAAATCVLVGCVAMARALVGPCARARAWAATGASLALLGSSAFLFEAANPMLEIFVLAAFCVHGAALLHVRAPSPGLPRAPTFAGLGFKSNCGFGFGSGVGPIGRVASYGLAAGAAVAAAAFKGPVALLLPVLGCALACLGRLGWAQVARVLALSVSLAALLVGIVAWHRARHHLEPFFANYWARQVLPSMRVGRHNPDVRWGFYLPVLMRWHAVGVVGSVLAGIALFVDRSRAPGSGRPPCEGPRAEAASSVGLLSAGLRRAAAELEAGAEATAEVEAEANAEAEADANAEVKALQQLAVLQGMRACWWLGAVWAATVVLAFSCMRQKYAWYVHLCLPGLALMVAAGSARGGLHFDRCAGRRRWLRRLGGWLGPVLLASALAAMQAKPALLRTSRPLIDAMHTLSPTTRARLAHRRVYLQEQAVTWKLHYLALFLWDAQLMPTAGEAECVLALRKDGEGRVHLRVVEGPCAP